MHNDIDMIDNITRTPSSAINPLNPTNSLQSQVVKKTTDSPPKTTPLASMTSVAPSVNSRKASAFLFIPFLFLVDLKVLAFDIFSMSSFHAILSQWICFVLVSQRTVECTLWSLIDAPAN